MIRGGRGVDVISGGEGSDLLKGKRGDEVLDGGEGADTVKGGRGDDECVTDPTDKKTKSCRGVELDRAEYSNLGSVGSILRHGAWWSRVFGAVLEVNILRHTSYALAR